MSKEKKVLKRISFDYLMEGQKIDQKGLFRGYYKHVYISEDKWLNFYYTLTDKQKKLLSKVWE